MLEEQRDVTAKLVRIQPVGIPSFNPCVLPRSDKPQGTAVVPGDRFALDGAGNTYLLAVGGRIVAEKDFRVPERCETRERTIITVVAGRRW